MQDWAKGDNKANTFVCLDQDDLNMVKICHRVDSIDFFF